MKKNAARILHYIGSLHMGGTQAFIMSIYHTIDLQRLQFDFVVQQEQESGFYNDVKNLGGKIYICPRYSIVNHFAFCQWWNDFFVNHPEYKIIHGHVRSTAAIYLSIAQKHGLIAIAHSHSTSNGKGVSALVKNIMQFPIRYTADYLFACSEKAGQWLYGKHAIRKKNYRMIANGIDIHRFSFSQETRQAMRAQLGVENCFVIGHIGRFVTPKNHDFIIDVFAQIAIQNNNARLLLVGEGERKGEIKQRCIDLKLNEKVIFVGEQKQTEQYYQAMDSFLFPSLWEGLPVAVVEAQASGLPCILSDTVPSEVCITNRVKQLSLQAPTQMWAQTVCQYFCDRNALDCTEMKQMNRFDIQTVADELQQFYVEKVGQ